MVKDRLKRERTVVVDKRDVAVLEGAIEFAASGEDPPIAIDQIRALQRDIAQRLTIPYEVKP